MLTPGQISVPPHLTLPIHRVVYPCEGAAASKLLQSLRHSLTTLGIRNFLSTLQQRNLNECGKIPSGWCVDPLDAVAMKNGFVGARHE